EHRQALEQALAGGVNLVDTSTNYTAGASERLMGAVLGEAGRAGRRARAAGASERLMGAVPGEAARAGRLRREEAVVVSKIGYLQGDNLQRAKEREAAGRPYPEVVKYADDVWHCIHPEFLADQLAESLDRLGLATLDVCLLHN